MTEPIKITAQTVGRDDAESIVITDTYNLVVAGNCYLASAQVHDNGTHVLVIKGSTGTATREAL